jgi:eukaryotic-like serine/threonine-protein kinase
MTAPTKIGRYEIVRRIGKSMTDVYLAIDTVENRKAALKLVKAGGDSASRQILEAERRGAAIQRQMFAVDPRMVEIYDFGDLDGYFFVAMQFVEGRNLAEVLRAEQALDPNRAAVIALEICEQLAKFHSWRSAVARPEVGPEVHAVAGPAVQTVVHGDIKPSNIHIGPNDTVRLLDFGIAKTLRPGRDATAHNFGSPGYCSPERLLRSEVDQQSDLWAVGATLYEMLAGVPPYQAQDTRKLEDLIRAKRPPRALPSSVPKPLRLVVSKSLARDEAQRYRSAVEFMADLQAFLSHKPTLAEMERRAGWNPNATIEAARAALKRATRTVKQAGRHWRLIGAFGWFAAGMALWIAGALVWQSWQSLQAQPVAAKPGPARPVAAKTNPAKSVAAKPAPMAEPGIDWLAHYVAEGDGILAAYRASSDPVLHHFDWHKAEIRLQDAADQGRRDDATLGKLALAKGYAVLEHLSVGEFSDAGAAQLRQEARADFEDAAKRMPGSADAHLALARVFVYSMPDLDRALAEFHQAETLGAKIGAREIEAQGDAYRIRAQQVAWSAPREAWQAAQAARVLYRQVGDFDRAKEHLQELAPIHQPAAKKAPTHRSHRWR